MSREALLGATRVGGHVLGSHRTEKKIGRAEHPFFLPVVEGCLD